MKMKIIGLHRKFLKVIPIVQWLPQYDLEIAISDLIAGITVGLTLIPQSIAYASLAGLSPQYGLYSSLVGGIIYMLFGTIPEISIGPTSLLSLLTYNYTHNSHPDFAVLLCFLSGCIEILCGLMNLGFLVDFVSVTVVSGFTSAAAIIIASSQVKGLLGIKFNAESFIEIWVQIIDNVSETKKWDVVLGIFCCTILLLLKYIGKYGVSINKKVQEKYDSIKKLIWFISVSRNAIIVVLCAVMTFILELKEIRPFSLSGKVVPGLPVLGPPPFQIEYHNHTANFGEVTTKLGSGIIVVPLVAIISNVAISKAFSHGKNVDASQEMLALGMCNLVASFFNSMPINGAFSRSAVYNASGVRTPFGGLYTSTLVILALCFLTPYFSYIPKATLSSVLICAVIFMIDVSIVRKIWHTHKKDLAPYLFTLLACLFVGVEIGILMGMSIDLIILLYYNARPHIQIDIYEEPGFTYLKPKGDILFPAVEHMRRAISKAGIKSSIIVIDCEYITRVDFSAAQGIGNVISELHKADKKILLIHIKPSVAHILTTFCEDKYVIIKSNEDVNARITGYTASTLKKDPINIELTKIETTNVPEINIKSVETRLENQENLSPESNLVSKVITSRL